MEAVAESDENGFFVVELARRETQCQINNDGKNNHAGDANSRALSVGRDHCQGARREGDNGDDDG